MLRAFCRVPKGPFNILRAFRHETEGCFDFYN
jgi:hypothetical protein